MNRKSFLRSVGAAIASLFCFSANKASELMPRGEPLRLRPVKPKLAPEGCARTFRRDAHGEFWEIDRRQVKAGDVIAMIGLNETTGRLWFFKTMVTDADFSTEHSEFGSVQEKDGTGKEWLKIEATLPGATAPT